MRVGRVLMCCAIAGFASACAYTWGIEHVPVIGRPGPHSGWVKVHGGPVVYDVDVHVPRTVSGALPLVIVLHGYSGTGPGMERRTRFSAIADSAGFVVAYPDARKNTQGRRAWSSGESDVAMLRALVDSVAARVSLDRHRIYLAGFSNGGMFTYRAAMAMPGTFAAIGVVAGAMSGSPDRRADAMATSAIVPVPLIAVHGMQDDNVVYDPGPGSPGRLGAPGSVRAWASRNACAAKPAIDTLTVADAIRTTYTGCRGTAVSVLYSLPRGGHDWPNAGTTEAPFPTSDVLWRFFSEHRVDDSLVTPDGRA